MRRKDGEGRRRSARKRCSAKFGRHKSLSESTHEPAALDVQRAADELTERQLDIVRRLLRGEKTREIADALDISLRTVQGHKLAIYRKFGVHTAAQFAELGPVLGVESGSET